MNKRVFLAHLKLELRGLSAETIADIMKDYDQYFQEVSMSGMGEKEAIEKLGDPRDIAAKIKRETSHVPKNYKRDESTNTIIIISLIFFNLVFVLGPVVGIVGLIFGLFVMSGVFIVSPIIVLIKFIIGNYHLFELFLTLFLAGVGLLIIPLLIKGICYGTKLVGRYAHWNLKHMRGESS